MTCFSQQECAPLDDIFKMNFFTAFFFTAERNDFSALRAETLQIPFQKPGCEAVFFWTVKAPTVFFFGVTSQKDNRAGCWMLDAGCCGVNRFI